MNGYERFKFGVAYIVIVVAFILIGLSFFTEDSSKEYLERGIKVEVTITESTGMDSYHGTYTEANGNQVYTEILPNDFSATIGTVLEGYYLPEKPDRVWCKPSESLTLGLKIVVGVIETLLGICIIVGVWAFFRAKKIQREENQALWRAAMEDYQRDVRR